MNELISMNIDNLVSYIIEKDLSRENYKQVSEHIKTLSSYEIGEFNSKLKVYLTSEHKKRYEDIAREVFEKMNSRTLGAIYETSRCIGLELMSGVYFLRNENNGLIKIGCSKNLSLRIGQIATAFKHIGYNENLKLEAIHLCFEPHLALAETYFHNEFREKRVRGEWFDISNEELCEYFYLGDSDREFIGEVLVSLSDYESFNFKPLSKDFKIDFEQAEYELFKDVLQESDNSMFRTGIRNKFYKIIRTVEENNLGIDAIEYSSKSDSACKKGITIDGAEGRVDLLELKHHMYDSQKVKEMICSIDKRLRKGIQRRNNLIMLDNAFK